MKRRISKKNVLLALVLTTLIFIIGIIVGNFTSDKKYSSFESELSDLRIKTMSMELQYDLLAEDPCNISEPSFLLAELSELNSKLEYLERLYGPKDPEILQLKEYYSILQIQHWLLFKKTQRECKSGYGLILYFYSNEKCDGCQTQGVVLTAFRKKYIEEVKVYSFDVNLDDPAVKTLIDKYKISTAPSIVYNDQVYPHIMQFDMLEEARFNHSISTSSENETGHLQ